MMERRILSRLVMMTMKSLVEQRRRCHCKAPFWRETQKIAIVLYARRWDPTTEHDGRLLGTTSKSISGS